MKYIVSTVALSCLLALSPGCASKGFQGSDSKVIEQASFDHDRPPDSQLFLELELEQDELAAEELTAVDLVLIPGGRFMMGSPAGVGYEEEHPQHAVELASFYMAKTEVTNAQYARYLDANPDALDILRWNEEDFTQPNQPVIDITWQEAKAYCEWAGLELPTEAQWEYAARAGTRTEYWSGNGEEALAKVGWYEGNSKGRLHPVGEKSANPFGLYDMHGNVREWCRDGRGNYNDPPRKGDGLRSKPDDDSHRVVRGGGWATPPGYARSANRSGFPPDFRLTDLGFRCVRAIP